MSDSLEFERAYRQGNVFKGKLYSVHAYPNELGNSRLGLSVSKKVGNAVARNTVRRRLKQVFYAAKPRISSDLDFVISARPACAEASFGDLAEEFDRALRKLDGSSQSAAT